MDSIHQARLAQSVEHQTLNRRVVGSSPTVDKNFFILYFVASDALLAGRLAPCKWNQAWRPSQLYMCIERESWFWKPRSKLFKGVRTSFKNKYVLPIYGSHSVYITSSLSTSQHFTWPINHILSQQQSGFALYKSMFKLIWVYLYFTFHIHFICSSNIPRYFLNLAFHKLPVLNDF